MSGSVPLRPTHRLLVAKEEEEGECVCDAQVFQSKHKLRGSTSLHPTPPPPLRKHKENQESDGQTGSWRLDKAVLARNARYQKNACPENLPIPHPEHNSHNRALEHNVLANFSKFWRSSLPIRGIRSCGIEALSNLVRHLEQLHMLALWGRLWGRLWNGFRLPVPWHKTVIHNIFAGIRHGAQAHAHSSCTSNE